MRIYGVLACVIGFELIISPVWAAASPSLGLSMRFLCDTLVLTQGQIGLLIGFAIAIYGLYQIIVSGALKTGLIFILVGAMLTALPGIIRTGLMGASEFLQQVGISTGSSVALLDQVYGYASSKSCDTIPIDMSQYDSDDPMFYAPPQRDSNGKVIPGTGGGYYQGKPDMKGSSGGGGSPEMRRGSEGSNAPSGSCKSAANSRKSVPGASGILAGTPILTDCYGYSETRGRIHRGVDLGSSLGKNNVDVKAYNSGTAAFIGQQRGTGNMITVKGGDTATNYFHLAYSPTQAGIRLGGSVSAGQKIGTMGGTFGYAVHLHFEYLQNGVDKNPCSVLGCPM